MVARENIEWCDIWVTAADEATLPRVLLIGDSIARSYYGAVEQALQGRAHCARLASSKCLCDPAFLKELALVLDEYSFAVIHLNNGLHGWGYTEDAYREDLPRVLHFIRQHAPESRLIWAQTTPIWRRNRSGELDARNARVLERNRIAAEIAASLEIPINDLYTLVVGHPEYMAEDGVHFNAQGQALLGRQVAQEILRRLA